jgi:beta-lactamase class D
VLLFGARNLFSEIRKRVYRHQIHFGEATPQETIVNRCHRHHTSPICITTSIAVLLVVGGASFAQHTPVRIQRDLSTYYDAYGVRGTFALYDSSTQTYILYNPGQFEHPFTPASTFKICNSLIGLETGVIPDENYVIPWDSVHRNPVWDKDHDLKTAYRNSTVWYYQELARRVGGERMKHWLDAAHYGNADTSGGIDRFWLSGGLRITPKQQLDFLRRLHDNMLPFSQRSITIVTSIMIARDTLGYILRGKSGWGTQDGEEIGWFVGYVEAAGKVYYFANCVQADSADVIDERASMRFDRSRRGIVYRVLEDMNVITPFQHPEYEP